MMPDVLRAPGLQACLDALRLAVPSSAAAPQAEDCSKVLPRLHGNPAATYREWVAALRAALRAGAGAEILEGLRTLVDYVLVCGPAESGAPRMGLTGHLTALLEAYGAPRGLTADLYGPG